MNTIGIDHNLDRARIKKLLTIGLVASFITGAGDFLLGYAKQTAGVDLATSVMAGAACLTDGQIIAGSLLGMFGLFLEGLACFGIYRLMADASPKYAHIYRAGIFGYIYLAPIGCHLNMGLFNLAYKYLMISDAALAVKMAQPLFYGFGLPVYILLMMFYLPMIIIQYKAFSQELTPFPSYAKWFNVIIGSVPAFLISAVVGMNTALGAAVGTMFLSFGNAFMFGGLLRTLPSEERFEAFWQKLHL